MKKVLYILAVVVLVVLNATPVFADTTAIVTILGVPVSTTGGITNFTVVYINDSQMDMTWGFSGSAVNIMIRGKYGEFPTDIPNPTTAPSDGWLVYYGSGTSASDTSVDMNFNDFNTVSDTSDTPFTVYYKAWAQKGDGTWFVKTSTGSKESKELVLISLIALGVIGSIFAIMKRNILFAIGAGVVWFFLITYTRANPLPNIATGSSADGLFIGVCVAFSIGTILSIFWLNNNAEKKENPPPDEQIANRHNARGSGYESPEAYQARLYALTHPKRK